MQVKFLLSAPFFPRNIGNLVLATYRYYRLAWPFTGKLGMERFQTYGEAKRRAGVLVKKGACKAEN